MAKNPSYKPKPQMMSGIEVHVHPMKLMPESKMKPIAENLKPLKREPSAQSWGKAKNASLGNGGK